LKFLAETHKGVRGKIQDEDGQPVGGAKLKVTTTTTETPSKTFHVN